MQELIREYGRAVLSAMAGTLAIGILLYACTCIISYMEFFADWLMGGTGG